MKRIVKGRRLLAVKLVAAALLWGFNLSAQENTVDSETCLDCHDGYELSVAQTPHRLTMEDYQPAGRIGCTSCHEGDDVHIEDPSLDNVFNPATDDAQQAVQVCSGCHNPHQESGDVVSDHLMRADVTCTSCHAVHQAATGADQASICGSCHAAMMNRFSGTSAHPVVGEELGCLDCHSVGSRDIPYQEESGSVDCGRCHPDYSGPHRYEHEAAWSFTTEGGGRVACHDAHGSVNNRLLRQPADNLCRQCHGVPPLHRETHNGIGSNHGCTDCHSEIHGSNHNSHLLDPQLGSKVGDGPDGCYCHNVYE